MRPVMVHFIAYTVNAQDITHTESHLLVTLPDAREDIAHRVLSRCPSALHRENDTPFRTGRIR